MNKKILIVKLIVWILLFVVVAAACAACVGVIKGSWRGSFPIFHLGEAGGTPELVLTEQFDSKDFNALEISTASADIRITTGGSRIEVKYYSSEESEKTEPKLTVKENGSTLSIKTDTRFFFTFTTPSRYIEVRVPEQYLADYTVNSASGDITFSANALSCSLSSVSGEVDCSSDSAESVELNSTSGDIHCAAAASEIEMNTTSGNLVSTVPVKTLRADSVSGGISLVADGDSTVVEANTISGKTELSLTDVADYRVDFSTVSGDLTDYVSDRDSEHDANYRVGDGTLSVSVSSVSGDFRID